jgi:UDP-glucose 4-epimerase
VMDDSTAWLDGATVLVTGATGRIGGRLTTELRGLGASVRTVALPDDNRASALPADVEVITGTLSDATVVAQATEDVDAVVHLAALMDWDPDANPALFESNVQATYLLLDHLVQRSPNLRRFVLASSDEVYSALDVKEQIVEDHPIVPYSFYGLTKQLDEVLAEFYHRVHGVPTSVARFSLTAEADEITRHDGWSGRLFFASGLRAILDAIGRPNAVAAIDAAVDDAEHTLVLARDTDGNPYRFQFCDARDLVSGLLCLLTAPGAVGETCNLSGPEAFSYADVVPQLSEAIGVPYVDLRLDGARIDLSTSTERAREVAGFVPRIGISEILAQVTSPDDVTS